MCVSEYGVVTGRVYLVHLAERLLAGESYLKLRAHLSAVDLGRLELKKEALKRLRIHRK